MKVTIGNRITTAAVRYSERRIHFQLIWPTRGLDVGSIEYIHRRLIEQRDKGKAVLLVSLELDEVLNLSDRIAVINNGELVGIVKTSETNERELGLMMAGYQKEEAPHE